MIHLFQLGTLVSIRDFGHVRAVSLGHGLIVDIDPWAHDTIQNCAQFTPVSRCARLCASQIAESVRPRVVSNGVDNA
jgi:hypothetical protein